MPEGDTIFLAAQRLRQVLEGHRISVADTDESAGEFSALNQSSVCGVEARGKHLLIQSDADLIVHSHLGMDGAWHVYPQNAKWRRPRWQAQLCLRTESHEAVCFRPKTLELLTSIQLRRHDYLRRLGPDLLSAAIDSAEVIRRFRLHNHVAIGEAIMNQSIVCGVGNVYKSEVLFLTQQCPFSKIVDLDDSRITEIIEVARFHLQRNLTGHRRQTRFAGPGDRLWVYGRNGQPCLKCGTTVELRRQGPLGRTTYFCATCQTASQKAPEDVSANDQGKRRIRISGV